MSRCIKCGLDIGETIYVRCGPCSDEFNKATAERDRCAVVLADQIPTQGGDPILEMLAKRYQAAREMLASLQGGEGVKSSRAIRNAAKAGMLGRKPSLIVYDECATLTKADLIAAFEKMTHAASKMPFPLHDPRLDELLASLSPPA